MGLPTAVEDVCGYFLSRVPAGLVTGLYLTGGLGFGEWVEGQSDVDFIATLSHRPSEAEVRELRAVHEEMASFSPIDFDGLHVLTSDLARDPRDLPVVPVVLHHEFRVGHLDQLVAWHELAWHGVSVMGSDLSTLDIWTDVQVLREYTVNNLGTYWRDIAGQLTTARTAATVAAAASRTASPEDLVVLPDEACCWCVLGVARLHHLIVTDRMTTKSGAGRWGLTYYDDRWHRVLREALRLREGGTPEYDHDGVSRLHDVTAFVADVVERGTGRPLAN